MNLDRYQQLKSKAEKAKAEADRAEGVYDSLLSQLKEEFECDTVEEAEELLKELERKEKKAERRCGKAIKEFEEKWEEQLDDF